MYRHECTTPRWFVPDITDRNHSVTDRPNRVVEFLSARTVTVSAERFSVIPPGTLTNPPLLCSDQFTTATAGRTPRRTSNARGI